MPAEELLPYSSSSLFKEEDQNLGYKGIEQRKSLELVFAFVEPIGGGSKGAADTLKRLLESNEFEYVVNPISMSSLIRSEVEKRSLETFDIKSDCNIENASNTACSIYNLQQQGNQLRDRFGYDYLTKLAISEIVQAKVDNNGYEEVEGGVTAQRPIRIAHIIRSIKHEDELKLLKSIYGNILFVIGTSGSYKQQLNNFRSCGQNDDAIKQREYEYEFLSKIDQKESIDNGQQVRKVFYKADLFLNSQNSTHEEQIRRFLNLLFGRHILSPTNEETMMSAAFAARLRSTCLSRQVGAAICDEEDEFVSVGWNDVPAFGGGLASDHDEKSKDALCKKNGCRSGEEISALLSKLYEALKKEGLLQTEVDKTKVEKTLHESGLDTLIEFSRAIHAEMEAILSAARTAKKGLKGGRIYVTTYPCDNCAKHILAVGLREVVYIEPYPKSRAKDFFFHLIEDAERQEETGDKLIFKQFVGLAPRTYSLFFEKWYERKNDDGSCVNRDTAKIPLTDVYLDSYPLYENHIVEILGKGINDAKAKTITSAD